MYPIPLGRTAKTTVGQEKSLSSWETAARETVALDTSRMSIRENTPDGIKDPNGRLVDVRQYGADASAIQAAIDAAKAADTIALADGTYEISSPIEINKSDITVKSFGKTTLNVSGAIRGLNVTGARVTVRHVSVAGDNTVGSCGIHSNAVNTVVEDCNVADFDSCIEFDAADGRVLSSKITQSSLITDAGSMYGILVYNTTGALILDNTVTMPVYLGGTVYPIGIYVGNMEALIRDNQVINNKMYNGFDGISLRGPYTIVQSNVCEGASEAGIACDGTVATSTTTSRCTIGGNKIADCGRWGIYVGADSYEINVYDNEIYNCGSDAAIAFDAGDCNVTSRSVISRNSIWLGMIGIYIASNPSYTLERVVAVGNTISDCTSVGIAVSRADSVAILENRVFNCLVHGIQVSSSESSGIIVAGNTLGGNGTDIWTANGADVTIMSNIIGSPVETLLPGSPNR